MINYFNFKKLNNEYLITNDLGRYLFADKKELFSLINNQVDMNSDFGKSAEENMFCYDGSPRGFAEKENLIFVTVKIIFSRQPDCTFLLLLTAVI